MRTFEVVLLVMNALTLVVGFVEMAKGARRWLAGASVLVLFIHVIFEGFRYQMIFSYLLVILFAAFSLVKTNGKFFQAKRPKAVKVIAVCLSIILLACTSFLAYALPVFALPKPTGSYEVGVKYVHLVDEKRKDPFLEHSASNRELMIKIFYPASKDGTKPYLPYFHDSQKLIRAFTAFYRGFPSFTFDHLKLVKTHSKENAELSDRQPTYPVVLYSHGAGGSMEIQTSPCEDLASHGYVVVAIDHPYVSAATEFPDRTVLHREATVDFKQKAAEPAEFISEIMADDARFVMDILADLNTGKVDPLFKGKLDLDRIGAAGHSVGGAVAYNLAIKDRRIKAAVNVDGFVYTAPDKDAAAVAPFLMLANDKYHIQLFQKRQAYMAKFEDLPELDQSIMIDIYGSKEAYVEEYRKSNRNLNGIADVVKASGNLYTIQGSDHMKFTDIGLFIGSERLRELIGVEGSTSPVRCLEMTQALTTAFFDRHLKNESNDALDSLRKTYPELKRIAVP